MSYQGLSGNIGNNQNNENHMNNFHNVPNGINNGFPQNVNGHFNPNILPENNNNNYFIKEYYFTNHDYLERLNRQSKSNIILSDISENIVAFVLSDKKNIINILDRYTKIITSYPIKKIITQIKINPFNNYIIAVFTQEKYLEIIDININNTFTYIYTNKYSDLNTMVWSPDGINIAFNNKNMMYIYNNQSTKLTPVNRQQDRKHSSEILSIDWVKTESIDKIISSDKNSIIIYNNSGNRNIIEPVIKINNIFSNKLKWSPTAEYFISNDKKTQNILKINENGDILDSMMLNNGILNNFQFIDDHNFYFILNNAAYCDIYNSQNNIKYVDDFRHDEDLQNINLSKKLNLCVTNKNIFIPKKIYLHEMPLINELLNINANILYEAKIFYINKLFTDYKFFSLYVLKNNLLNNFKFKDTFFKVLPFTNFYSGLTINLNQYIDNIITFLNSIIDDKEIDRYYDNNNKNREKKLKYNTLGQSGLNRPNTYNEYENIGNFLEKISSIGNNGKIKDKYREKLELIKGERLLRKERILYIYTQFIKIILVCLSKIYNYPLEIISHVPKIILNIDRNTELKTVMDLIDTDNVIFRDIRYSINVKYNGEYGVNAGGLTREFFTNLGRQLNMHIELYNNVMLIYGNLRDKISRKIKIAERNIKKYEKSIIELNNSKNENKNKKQELLFEINRLKKDLNNSLRSQEEFKKTSIESLLPILNRNIRQKKNKFNELKREYNQIIQNNSKVESNLLIESKEPIESKRSVNLNNISMRLETSEKEFLNLSKEYEKLSTYNSQIKLLNDETKIIKVLALSKRHDQPIYFNDKEFTKKILYLLSLQYNKNIRKILINLLSEKNSLISRESLYKLSNDTINNNSLINEKYREGKAILNNQLTNLQTEMFSPGLNITSNYFLNLKKREKNIEDSVVELKFKSFYDKYRLNKNEKSDENLSMNPLYISIMHFVSMGIYKNLIDFYVSHFILVDVPIDLIIKNLRFEYFDVNPKSVQSFINKFKILLGSFDIEEAKIFNEAISGSILLNNQYKIEFKNIYPDEFKLPKFHTCFFSMEIFNFSHLDIRYFYFDVNKPNLYKDKDFLECKDKFIDFLRQTILSGYGFS